MGFIHSSNSNFKSNNKSLPPIDFSKTNNTKDDKGKNNKGKGKDNNNKGKGQKDDKKGGGKGVNKLNQWDDDHKLVEIKNKKGKGQNNENNKGKGQNNDSYKGKGQNNDNNKGNKNKGDDKNKGNKNKGDDKNKGTGKGKVNNSSVNAIPIPDPATKRREDETKRKAEEKRKVEEAKKAQELLKQKLPKWTEEIEEVKNKMSLIEKIVEEYRDVTAALTSDVAEHLSANDVILSWNEGVTVKEKLDVPMERVQAILKELSSDNLFKTTDLQSEYMSQREKQKNLVSGFKQLEKVCKKYHNKALEEKNKEALAEKEKEKQEELKKLEQWNKEIISEAAEYCIIGQISAKRARSDSSHLVDAERELKRAKFVIEEAMAKEGA